MEYPFEFCALRFLIQWQRREEPLHSLIKERPSLNDLRSALSYFQISRNFVGLGDKEKAASVLKSIRLSLLAVRTRKRLTAEQKVIELATKFKKEFQFNLSAASKLLWLSSRCPFIIYDSRAANALRNHLNHKFKKSDYAAYCAAWRIEFEKNRDQIEGAVRLLPKVRALMPQLAVTDAQMIQMAATPWFTERVFDIYLWELGGEG